MTSRKAITPPHRRSGWRARRLAGGRGPAADEESEDDPEGEIADGLERAPRTVANRPGLIRSLRRGAGEP